MPLAQLCDKAYKSPASGKAQVIISSLGPRDILMDVLRKRRSAFEFLANTLKSR